MDGAGPPPTVVAPASRWPCWPGVASTFAVLFFQVVRPFALPLFLAVVFAVLAFPLHERLPPVAADGAGSPPC